MYIYTFRIKTMRDDGVYRGTLIIYITRLKYVYFCAFSDFLFRTYIPIYIFMHDNLRILYNEYVVPRQRLRIYLINFYELK